MADDKPAAAEAPKAAEAPAAPTPVAVQEEKPKQVQSKARGVGLHNR